LPNLGFELRADQLAGLRIKPDLSRGEYDEAGLDGLRVRADRGRRRARNNVLFMAPFGGVDEGA
jgi:hypothetical protein